MPVEALRCPHCGARLARPDAARCDYCGTLFRSQGEASATESLERLKSHPDLPRLLAESPDVPSQLLGTALMVVFGLAFAGVALFAVAPSAALTGPLAIVPFLLALVGLLVAAQALARAIRLRRAPLERRLAQIVAMRRLERHAAESDRPAVAGWFVTLEFPDGSRRELRTSERQSGLCSVGDAGVAYVHAAALLDFERLRA